MPVIDHPVTSGAVSSETHRYGCFNRPAKFQDLVLEYCAVENGKVVAKSEDYEHRMSHGCRYDQSLTDKFCAGCKHAGSGEKYVADNQAKGAK